MEENQPPKSTSAPAKKQISASTLVASLVVVAITFFILGTRSYMLPALFSGSSAPARLDYQSLDELYSSLKSKYDGTINTEKLIDGAKHGMIDALGDPYTTYLSSEEAKAFDNDLNGTFEGIGAELGKMGGQLTILSVISGSPAEKSALKKNDIILKVNDEDASSMTIGGAVTKIRGEKGTSVKLTILRDDTSKEYSITRDTITSPSVESEILDGNIGYIRILRFSDDTASLARQVAEKFKDDEVSGVILDLRGNGGGLLSSAQSVSSLWLKDKTIVSERKNGITTDTLRSKGDAVLEGIKTIVLVDGGSASASEIVAGALKDNKVAVLLGEKTFGKGSVQTIDDLADGSKLKVTIAKWYTPNGLNIDKEGIVPDVEIKQTEADTKSGKDTQKASALSRLRQ